MNLEFIAIVENSSSRRMPRLPDTLRVFLILRALSGRRGERVPPSAATLD